MIGFDDSMTDRHYICIEMSSFLHRFQGIVFHVRRKTEEPEEFFMSKENKFTKYLPRFPRIMSSSSSAGINAKTTDEGSPAATRQ